MHGWLLEDPAPLTLMAPSFFPSFRPTWLC